MLKAETTPTRAPRGTKPVSQAFLAALDAVPEPSRAAVAKAALVMIRDELKARKEKMKAVAAKEKQKAVKPAAPAKAAKAKTPRAKATVPHAAKSNGSVHAASPVKRRSRKPADLPTAN